MINTAYDKIMRIGIKARIFVIGRVNGELNCILREAFDERQNSGQETPHNVQRWLSEVFTGQSQWEHVALPAVIRAEVYLLKNRRQNFWDIQCSVHRERGVEKQRLRRVTFQFAVTNQVTVGSVTVRHIAASCTRLPVRHD
jgi:hypothetical protein